MVFMIEKKEELRSITIRVPRELYANYKKALLAEGKIVTYDLRRYMNEIVEKSKKGQK